MPNTSNIIRFTTGNTNHTGLRLNDGSIRVLRLGDTTWQTKNLGMFDSEADWRNWAAENEKLKNQGSIRNVVNALASFLLGNASFEAPTVRTRSTTRAAEALIQLSQSAPTPAVASPEPRYNLRSRRA